MSRPAAVDALFAGHTLPKSKAALDEVREYIRDLCVRLHDSTMAEIAREMGIPRTTIYDRLSKLREAFREAGLTDYL